MIEERNEGEDADVLCRRIPNNLCGHLPLKVCLTPHLFIVGSDLLPKSIMWMEGKSNFIVETLTGAVSSRVIKANINSGKSRPSVACALDLM